jgi:hypothetical protein
MGTLLSQFPSHSCFEIVVSNSHQHKLKNRIGLSLFGVNILEIER